MLWEAHTGNHKPCVLGDGDSCRLVFQTDGNLVEYYNGKSIWSSKTLGHDRATLFFANKAPFMYIINANQQVIWRT